MRHKHLSLVLSALLVLAFCVPQSQDHILLRPRLNDPVDLSQWDLVGSGSWRIDDGKLVLAVAGKPEGPIRRPAALAILKTAPLRRVTLQVQIRSNAPINVPRRDLDLIFGYESPRRFYYVHFSAITDSVHNGIFLVANADCRRIDAGTGQPQLKDQQWHSVRVERNGMSGTVQVFVDGSRAPVLTASDTTIGAGCVGVGSFEGTGEFRRISVSGSIK